MKRQVGTYRIESKWLVKGYEHLGYMTIKSLYYYKEVFKAELYCDGSDKVSIELIGDEDLLKEEDIIEKALNSAREFMKDPDNARQFKKSLNKKLEFGNRQCLRVCNRTKNLSNEEFSKLLRIFIHWERKYRHYNLTTHHRDINSWMFSALVSVFDTYGERIDDDIDDSDFKYLYKGVTMEIIAGQGCYAYKFENIGNVKLIKVIL